MTSRLVVNSIRHTGSSTDAVTLASNGSCAVNNTQRQGKNLIINGAMNIAQRQSNISSSTASGYGSVDRFQVQFSGTDEAPTQAQVDLASSDTPYTLGFRKALKVTNGNQTSGAGAADYVNVEQRIEAQNVANSGWNYTSSSSFVTLSFWIKSSVAQNFYGFLFTEDGAERLYSFETGSLTANTWTKVTKTIPGNSIVQINNDNGFGLQVVFQAFAGTDFTASGATLNQWRVWNGGERFPDMTSTWYTTNDSTFEITGVQLEVGSVATDFEHISFHDELYKCYRYFQRWATGDGKPIGNGFYYNSTQVKINCNLLTTMRTVPTMAHITGTHYYVIYRDGAADTFDNLILEPASDQNRCGLYNYQQVSGTAGQTGIVRCNNAAPNGGQIDFSAEL